VHLVTRLHFRSRDKDGSHINRSAVVESPHAEVTALWFVERELLPKFYSAGIGIFRFFAPVTLALTFIYELDPYCREIQGMCKY